MEIITLKDCLLSFAQMQSDVLSACPFQPLQGNITLAPGALLDREVDTLPHDENGNAVYRFGVTAVDKGTPAQLNYATVSVSSMWTSMYI